MTQRTLAALIALPLVLVLLVLSWVVSLPYSVYSPGPMIDVLGEYDGRPIVRVEGHRTYPTSGALSLTTVSETTKDADLSLGQLVISWLDHDNAVVPLEVAHPDEKLTAEQEKKQSIAQMASSQEVAAAAALHRLGYDIARPTVAEVEPHSPAEGKLRKNDVIVRVDGTKVRSAEQLVSEVSGAQPGRPIALVVRRGGKRHQLRVVPHKVNGQPRVGIAVGETYDFPFTVSVNIDPNIGGPSAGLMMSLGIYDTLTPGKLTRGQPIAGTGTIEYDGTVGPIGGIEQKIAAAREKGARLFLVPKDNCVDVTDLDTDGMRLVRTSTMKDAIHSIRAWAKDPEASLPSCSGSAAGEGNR